MFIPLSPDQDFGLIPVLRSISTSPGEPANVFSCLFLNINSVGYSCWFFLLLKIFLTDCLLCRLGELRHSLSSLLLFL